jgi:gliding motility-associated-like protein
VENNDTIKELFKEKLGDFEANVRPEIWSSISSQLVSSPVGVGTFASSILTKGAVALSIVAAVSAVVYFSSNQTEPSNKSLKETDSKALTATETFKEQAQKVETSSVKAPVQLDKDQPFIKEFITGEVGLDNILPQENVNNRIEAVPGVQEASISQTPLDNTTVVRDNTETITVVKPFVTEVSTNLNEANSQAYTLELPNVFTPNNDGINDFLIINTEGLTEFSLVVLDQRNKIIYTSQDTTISWDGLSFSGETVPSGNYVYFITARDSTGNLVTKHSVLRIER